MQWSRLRTLTWLAGDAGSNLSKIRAPSRNDVTRSDLRLNALEFRCATAWEQFADRRESRLINARRQATTANSIPRRFDVDGTEQGLQPPPSSVFHRLKGEAIRTNPAAVQIFGHLSANHRFLQPGKQRFGLCEGKPDVIRRGRQHRTADAYHLYGLHLAPARLCLQPDRPFHEPLPRSRSMRITPPNSLPTSQECPRFLPLPPSAALDAGVLDGVGQGQPVTHCCLRSIIFRRS